MDGLSRTVCHNTTKIQQRIAGCLRDRIWKRRSRWQKRKKGADRIHLGGRCLQAWRRRKRIRNQSQSCN
ncbi:hypothetical protein PG989_001291 [Apiospora arundinis]